MGTKIVASFAATMNARRASGPPRRRDRACPRGVARRSALQARVVLAREPGEAARLARSRSAAVALLGRRSGCVSSASARYLRFTTAGAASTGSPMTPVSRSDANGRRRDRCAACPKRLGTAVAGAARVRNASAPRETFESPPSQRGRAATDAESR